MRPHPNRIATLGADVGLMAATVTFAQTVAVSAAAADTTLTDCTQSGLQPSISGVPISLTSSPSQAGCLYGPEACR
jgi:hypothetical protein